ncbi:trace amine-associated receptor 9-like [Actinia tenebrosa]|uniref:Trace amine-associated receptor 9-like n=1 Tax=Actinia tenebrosa TaxID=6105 RepID=A0A6P8J765_ACTTE|nr:trace amine-associated receptor 9-like [Actinia tenebrosa]
MNAIPIDPKCYGELMPDFQVLFTVLHVIFGLLASTGNFVVILAIYRTPSLRTVSNYFLVSVAFADFFVGFVVHPMLAVRCYENYWYSELPFAKAADILVLQSFTATSFGLCAISLDRYFAITSAIRYNELITIRVCIIGTVIIWTISIFYPFIRFVTTDPFELPMIWLLVCIVSVGIPFSIIAYCYFHIFKAARNQNIKIAAQNQVRKDATNVAKQYKAARTVAIVIGVVLLFWFPGVVITLIQVMADDCMKTKIMKVWFWGILCAMINSSVNPWLYAARMKNIRKAMKKIVMPNRRSSLATISHSFSVKEQKTT